MNNITNSSLRRLLDYTEYYAEVAVIVRHFANSYKPVHNYLIISVCLFGIVANILNIIMLRHHSMRGAITTLLLSLSIAQLGLLLNNVACSILGFISPSVWDRSQLDRNCNATFRSYGWMMFLLVTVNVSIVFHTIAVVHVTALALFRYLMICCNDQIYRRYFFKQRFVRLLVCVVYALVPVLCVPFYFNSNIQQLQLDAKTKENCNWSSQHRLYTITFSKLALDSALLKFNFWFFSTLCKLLPCCIIVGLNLRIIYKLNHFEKRRSMTSIGRLRFRGRILSGGYNNIAKTLLLVVTLFFIVEFPQGILNLLSGVYGPVFMREVHKPLGDFFDMLTVLYSSVNFVLYCTMSGKFRHRVKQQCCCWRAVPVDQPMESVMKTAAIPLTNGRPIETVRQHSGGLPLDIYLSDSAPTVAVPLIEAINETLL